MFALNWILADGITLKLGDQIWSFGLNVIVYLIVAAIVGFVAESLVGWHLPLGIVRRSFWSESGISSRIVPGAVASVLPNRRDSLFRPLTLGAHSPFGAAAEACHAAGRRGSETPTTQRKKGTNK